MLLFYTQSRINDTITLYMSALRWMWQLGISSAIAVGKLITLPEVAVGAEVLFSGAFEDKGSIVTLSDDLLAELIGVDSPLFSTAEPDFVLTQILPQSRRQFPNHLQPQLPRLMKNCCKHRLLAPQRHRKAKKFQGLLCSLGFDERVRGSHHIFSKEGVQEILNLQSKQGKAKVYQVKQVRNVILNYHLGGQDEDSV